MADPTILIRAVTEADLDALKAMETRPELALTEDVFAGQVAGDAIFAVALVDDVVQGSGVLDLRESDLQPEVKLLWVQPGFRRMGLGYKLTGFLEDEARAKGHVACFMAIDPNNEKAIPLAIDLGYSATGDHKFVEDPDAEQVSHPSQVSNYYAVYRKSLTIR
ncbi:GNAT family N-acetyltransferase [Aestuariimicrobium soli]|uniref:GNAT family N-acetyltransferase n=1 Tax=Aestuariimicrobium soli TaxID=2035834 RepID=UPI003EBB91FA